MPLLSKRFFPKFRLSSAATLVSLAVVCQPFTLSAAETGLEMMTTPNEVAGTRSIEAGDFALGIEQSLAALPARTSKSKSALYANLCIGYVKTNDFDTAEIYCEKGVEEGWHTWISYVNRGALRYVRGEYVSSLADFSRAMEVKPYSRVVRKNLNATQAEVAKLDGKAQQVAAQK